MTPCHRLAYHLLAALRDAFELVCLGLLIAGIVATCWTAQVCLGQPKLLNRVVMVGALHG